MHMALLIWVVWEVINWNADAVSSFDCKLITDDMSPFCLQSGDFFWYSLTLNCSYDQETQQISLPALPQEKKG